MTLTAKSGTADGQTVSAPFEGRFRVRLDSTRFYRLPQYGPETAVSEEYGTVFLGRQNAEDHASVCRTEGWPDAAVEILS